MSDGVEIPGCPACGYEFHGAAGEEGDSGSSTGCLVIGVVFVLGAVAWIVLR